MPVHDEYAELFHNGHHKNNKKCHAQHSLTVALPQVKIKKYLAIKCNKTLFFTLIRNFPGLNLVFPRFHLPGPAGATAAAAAAAGLGAAAASASPEPRSEPRCQARWVDCEVADAATKVLEVLN